MKRRRRKTKYNKREGGAAGETAGGVASNNITSGVSRAGRVRVQKGVSNK